MPGIYEIRNLWLHSLTFAEKSHLVTYQPERASVRFAFHLEFAISIPNEPDASTADYNLPVTKSTFSQGFAGLLISRQVRGRWFGVFLVGRPV